jgi:CO/xanthine dehydrogenase Mo-binding subunit
LNYEDVTTAYGDTSFTVEGGSQGGSTRMMTLGAAFHMAAVDAREHLFKLAAEALGVTPDELDAREGKIFVKADESQSKTHAEIASQAAIVGKGYTWPANFQIPKYGFPAGTPGERGCTCGAACEIAVDTETGFVDTTRLINGMDLGRMIFREGARSQYWDAPPLNIAEALWWETVHDPITGVRLTNNFLHNRYATTLDIDPRNWTSLYMEGGNAMGPYGCNGIGEPTGESYTIWAQAIYNALGVWVDRLPGTPQEILKALGKG